MADTFTRTETAQTYHIYLGREYYLLTTLSGLPDQPVAPGQTLRLTATLTLVSGVTTTLWRYTETIHRPNLWLSEVQQTRNRTNSREYYWDVTIPSGDESPLALQLDVQTGFTGTSLAAFATINTTIEVSSPSVPDAPVVTVNTANRSVAPGTPVSLDATLSGGDPTLQTWSASPDAGTFANSGATDTTWTAPSPSSRTAYTLTLSASNTGGSDSDTVVITVDPALAVPDAPVVTVNTANQTVDAGTEVSLDSTRTGGTPSVRSWSASPNAGTFDDASADDTTWTAPSPSSQTAYTLTRAASNAGGSDSDTVVITVRARVVSGVSPATRMNTEPQSVDSGQTLQLSAEVIRGVYDRQQWRIQRNTRTDDNPRWEYTTTEGGSFDNPALAEPKWTAPILENGTRYRLVYSAHNGLVASLQFVIMTVRAAKRITTEAPYPPGFTDPSLRLAYRDLLAAGVNPAGITRGQLDLYSRQLDIRGVHPPGLTVVEIENGRVIVGQSTHPPALTTVEILKDDIRAASVHPPALTVAQLVTETPVIPPLENLVVTRLEQDTAYLQARLQWEINVANPPTPSPDVYALDDDGDEFWLLDMDTLADSTLIGTLPTAMTTPSGMAVHNGALYAVDRDTQSLYQLLLLTPANSVRIGAMPVGLERAVGMVSHDSLLYAINETDRSLWVIDVVHPPNSFPVGTLPSDVETPGAMFSDGDTLYCCADTGLWDVDTLNPAGSTLVGAWPSGLTMPSGATVHSGTVYCTDADGQVWEVDTDAPASSTLDGALPAGLGGPTAIASFDPDAPLTIEYRQRTDGQPWGSWTPISGSGAMTAEHVVTFLAAGFASYGLQMDFQVRAQAGAAGPASNVDGLVFKRPVADLQVAAYQVRMDADGDGTFSADLDADWMTPLYLQRGFQYEGQRYGQSIAGNIRFTLTNHTHRFTLGDADGIFPTTTEAPEGKPLRVICQPPGTRARYQLGQGSIEDFEPKYRDSGLHTVEVYCLGILNRLADRQSVTQAYEGISGGAALVHLLDAAGFTAAQRGELNAPSPVNLWWAAGNALAETRELERILGAFAYEDEHDRIALQGVTVRALVSRQDPAAHFDMRELDDPDRPVTALQTVGVIERPSTNRQITNVAQARAQIYETRPSQELWRLSQPIELRGFDSIRLQIPAPPGGAFDFFLEATAVVTANSLQDGTGADMTAAVDVEQTLTAPHITLDLENTGGAGLFVTGVVVTGTSLVVEEVIDVEETNDASIAEYGERAYAQVPVFRDSTTTAREWCLSILSDLVMPVDRIAFTTVANFDFHTILSLKFGDHIHVHDGVSLESYYIDQIEHNIHDGLEHRVRFTCSPIVDYTGVILLDIGPALGVGTLAR